MAFSKAERFSIRDRALKAWRIYTEVTHPLTFDAIEDIYRLGFTERAWTAMKFLSEDRPEAFNAHGGFALMRDANTSVYFPFPPPKRPYLSIDYSAVSSEITNWCDKLIAARQRHISLERILHELIGIDRLGKIVGFCNTPGHLRAMWPALSPFMDDRYKNELRSRQRAPQPPAGYLIDYLHNKFDHFEELDQGLMTLSLFSDFKQSPVYPTVRINTP